MQAIWDYQHRERRFGGLAENKQGRRMFKTRLITSLVGIPLLIAILYQGGWYWKGFFILLAIVGLI